MKGIWTYHHLLPTVSHVFQMSLGEGHTPLVKSRSIGKALGLDHLYFKLELTNPSGSYKDRFAASAISHILQEHGTLCLATSSGNTGAALAAYSAAARIPCLLAIVDGAPEGKLQQMRIYGAHTFVIKGFGQDGTVTAATMEQLSAHATRFGTIVQTSAYHYCPNGMAGVQTISYELAEALPDQKMQVFVPAGGGGLTLAILKGFDIWKTHDKNFALPQVYCVQPKGNDTIASAIAKGKDGAMPIAKSLTRISGLQVPTVLDGDEVVSSCRASNGGGVTVEDESVYALQHLLATQEGIYCEPAGAVALAGLAKVLVAGEIDINNPVVCVVTGHGFKDTKSSNLMASAIPIGRIERVSDISGYIEQIIR